MEFRAIEFYYNFILELVYNGNSLRKIREEQALHYTLAFFFKSQEHLQARHRLSLIPLLSIKYPHGHTHSQKISGHVA